MINKLLHKLFYLNAWTVGYREIEDGITEIPSRDNKAKYELIHLSDHMYYADPFVFEDGDNTYLFVESMNRYRGIATISVSKYENGRFGKFKEIIKEPFHMSYPNVFRYNYDYYMIPETSGSGQVRLYKAKEFPFSWELCKVLLENGNLYTDNVIEIDGESVYFYAFFEANGEKEIELYNIDFEDFSLHKISPRHYIQNERPAGNPFTINGKVIRPVQDCSEYYGKEIKLYSHNNVTDEKYVMSLDEESYNIPIHNITGTHTLNRSRHFEVIDIKFDRFCLTRRWIWLINKLRRK